MDTYDERNAIEAIRSLLMLPLTISIHRFTPHRFTITIPSQDEWRACLSHIEALLPAATVISIVDWDQGCDITFEISGVLESQIVAHRNKGG